MTDLKSGKVIKISDNCIIGRSGNIETEYFAEDLYISEYHCKVIFENDEYGYNEYATKRGRVKKREERFRALK
jgi:hypothetical protein